MSSKRKRRNKNYIERVYDNKIYPAMENTKDGEIYGYINNRGDFVIKPKFTSGYDVNRANNAIVQEGKLWGIIDSKGSYIVEPKYDGINPYKEDRAIYYVNSNVGIIDENGKEIITKKYMFISDYSEGTALVSINGEGGLSKYGYIDKDGKEIIEPKFISGNDFKEGVALVKIDDDSYGLIDNKGVIINKYGYKYVAQYGNGLMVVAKSYGGPYGYINVEGKEVIPFKYTQAEGFKDGVAVVSTSEEYNGSYGLIDINGKVIYEPIYSNMKILGENRVVLGIPIGEDNYVKRNIYAIGDTVGRKLTDFIYLAVGEYKEGLAYVSDRKNTFFIDLTGKIDKSLPVVEGSGELTIKDNIIYANIDYEPYYLDKDNKCIYKPNNLIKLDKTYSILKYKYKPNINYLIYEPIIKGIANRQVQRQINNKLKEMSYFKEFTDNEQSSQGQISEEQLLTYDYYGAFEVKYYKKELLTLELSGYYYPLGAAHGMPNRKTPTINLVNGKFYTLSDLFMGGVYWVGELNKIIENMIVTDPQYEYVFKDSFKGIKPEQDFYIDDKNLYIYFPPYDIGPYSAGYITFKIPFKDIKGMINKNGDFYKQIVM